MQRFNADPFNVSFIKLIFLAAVFAVSLKFAQAQSLAGLPFITNFTVADYRQGPENFAITQDENGRIFVGNSNGIMLYDGSQWRIIKLDRLSNVHSLLKDSLSHRIYVGGLGEFGFIATDSLTNEIKYTNLTPEAAIDSLPAFHDVYNIYRHGVNILFHTNTGLFVYTDQGITHLPLLTNRNRVFQVAQEIYIAEEGKPLAKLRQGKIQPIVSGNEATSATLLGMASLGDETVVLSKDQGFFKLEKGKLLPFATQADSILLNHNAFVYPLNHDRIAVATQHTGLLVLDKAGKLLYHLTDENGLITNHIWHVFQEPGKENFWVSQDNGISQIEMSSPFTHFSTTELNDNQFFTLAAYEGKLYAAGSPGVLTLPIPIKQQTAGKLLNSVWPLSGIKSTSWYFLASKPTALGEDSSLLISSNGGLFEQQSKGKLRRLGKEVRAWFILPLAKFPAYAIANTAEGFWLIKQESAGWKLVRLISPPQNSYYYFAQDAGGSFWTNSPTTGLLRSTFADGPEGPVQFRLYTQKDGLPSHLNNMPFSIDGQLVVGTMEGVYYYNIRQDKFLPHSAFNKLLLQNQLRRVNWLEKDRFGRIFYVVSHERADGLYHEAGVAIKQQDGSYRIKKEVFNRLEQFTIYDFLTIDRENVMMATSGGVFHFNPEKDSEERPRVMLKKIAWPTEDSLRYFNGNLFTKTDSNVHLRLPYQLNSFQLDFGTFTPYKANTVVYQYFLKGIDTDWSDWTVATKRNFSTMKEGKYQLAVRAKNEYNQLSDVFEVSIIIAPPWYRTGLAWVMYGLLFIIFLWATSYFYSLRLKTKNKLLEETILERTSEVERRRKEIEHKNKLLVSKNNKIELQTEAIVRKNMALEEARSIIARQLKELQATNLKLEDKVKSRTSELEKAYQELLILKNELDTFIYKSSHDINGPLMRLRGLCQVADLSVKDVEAKQFIGLLGEETERAAYILKKLLTFYEVRNTEPTLSQHTIQEIMQLVEEQLQSANLWAYAEIDWEISPSISTITTDAKLLTIVLFQLLENAVVYRQGTSATINISLHKQKNAGINLSVCDNGIGIPPGIRNSIFEMFFRGSTKSRGPGLGLYTARTGATKLGGSLEYVLQDSNTCFVLVLPGKTAGEIPRGQYNYSEE